MLLQVVLLIVLSFLIVLMTGALVVLLVRERGSAGAVVCLDPEGRARGDTQPLRPRRPLVRNRRPGGKILLTRSIFCLTPSRVMVMGAGSLLVAAMLGFAVSRDSPGLQMAELDSYSWAAGLPRQVMQVNLAQYRSFSQYDPAIVSQQAGNFGQNACGLVAVSQAVVVGQQPRLAGTPQGFDAVISLMGQVRARTARPGSTPAYQGATGIQPSELIRAAQSSPASRYYDITARSSWTLSEMYQALVDGNIVIVDVLVNQRDEVPSTTPDTIAHYARVLGMDLIRRQIYLENTLGQQDGKSYWPLSLDDFMQVWQHPETQATIKPSRVDPTIREENVNHWALVMGKKE